MNTIKMVAFEIGIYVACYGEGQWFFIQHNNIDYNYDFNANFHTFILVIEKIINIYYILFEFIKNIILM